MAVSKLGGKNINDYLFESTADPYDLPDRLHKLATHLRQGDEDYDDAAQELESLLDRIVNTVEDEIDYEK